jgi:hypothetical protein
MMTLTWSSFIKVFSCYHIIGQKRQSGGSAFAFWADLEYREMLGHQRAQTANDTFGLPGSQIQGIFHTWKEAK